METAENRNRSYELAMYIWQILKTQMTIIMSWGLDPSKARVINKGMEIHVQGFLHKGFVQITLNEGTDLFEITLLSEERETVKFIEDVFLDCLVNTLDENIEKCENYEQRVSEYLRETQMS
ncbi:MAG: hypothetical protein IJ513_03215 [Bacteroidaceae bacterium]|nr:hypothetical protein [Bacteroidaceae bacterium]